jgi:hypothetical protein
MPAGAESIPAKVPESHGPHLIKFARRGETEIKQYRLDEFWKISGQEYLSELEFKDEKTRQRILKQCFHASKNGYIDADRKWLGALYSREIRNHHIANVSIRWIDETLGYGLFAEEEIKAWEYIGEYTGVVRRHYPMIGSLNDYCFLYPTSIFYFGKHLIDGQHKGNEIRYSNHSDDPNSESISVFCDGLFHMILRAIKDIPLNAQITYDYGDRYWRSRPRNPNLAESEDRRASYFS